MKHYHYRISDYSYINGSVYSEVDPKKIKKAELVRKSDGPEPGVIASYKRTKYGGMILHAIAAKKEMGGSTHNSILTYILNTFR